MIEQMDTDMVHPDSDHDIDCMPQNEEVTLPASPDREAEKVPGDQGDIKILEDNPEAEMPNIYFDESQHRFVKSCRVPTLDVQISPAQFEV